MSVVLNDEMNVVLHDEMNVVFHDEGMIHSTPLCIVQSDSELNENHAAHDDDGCNNIINGCRAVEGLSS